MVTDPRYWIPNPTGHRLIASRGTYGRDGEIVDSPFGPAVLIVTDDPDPDDWICDLCNNLILTRWGDEPFPVPMFGSYALCLDHFNESQDWPEEDKYGDPIPNTRLGDWPGITCSCQACTATALSWLPYLKRTLL